MSRRTLIILGTWGLCLGTLWGLVAQRKELAALRGQPAGEPGIQAANDSPATNAPASGGQSEPLSEEESHELLTLRGEVTRLSARKRELAGVAETSEQLRAQLAASQTNSNALPPGYVRKAQAQFMGYSTPDNTLQSLLWALQHHDLTNVLNAMGPEVAQSISARIQSVGSSEGFFKGADPMPGLAIQSRQYLPDGSAELQINFGPGIPNQTFQLRSINGEWKLMNPF